MLLRFPCMIHPPIHDWPIHPRPTCNATPAIRCNPMLCSMHVFRPAHPLKSPRTHDAAGRPLFDPRDTDNAWVEHYYRHIHLRDHERRCIDFDISLTHLFPLASTDAVAAVGIPVVY